MGGELGGVLEWGDVGGCRGLSGDGVAGFDEGEEEDGKGGGGWVGVSVGLVKVLRSRVEGSLPCKI